MKKISFLVIFIFPFLITACVMGPDDMLKSYNDNLYENVGGGIYMNPNGASVNTKLIPRDVYLVQEHNTFELEISRGYKDYQWSIKDKKTNKESDIKASYYILRIGSPIVDFVTDREYTLTLFVKNTKGVLFTDTATIKVVK